MFKFVYSSLRIFKFSFDSSLFADKKEINKNLFLKSLEFKSFPSISVNWKKGIKAPSAESKSFLLNAISFLVNGKSKTSPSRYSRTLSNVLGFSLFLKNSFIRITLDILSGFCNMKSSTFCANS